MFITQPSKPVFITEQSKPMFIIEQSKPMFIIEQSKLGTCLRNNSTVFEELEVSFVDLTVANAVLLATRSGASNTDICDRQIHT